MKLVLSVPSGYHVRELLLPLKPLLETDTQIERITCITPAADFREELFSAYGPKFDFVTNPPTLAEHVSLLNRLTPDVVITTTSGLDPHDVAILEAAQQSEITTVTFIASWDNVWKMERLHNQKKPQVVADHLIVWNQMMKDHLQRIFPDVSPDRIAILGAPRFDYFWHTDLIPTREQLLNYLSIPLDSQKLIHIATTELYPMDYLVKGIAESIKQKRITQPAHLYASVHPGGDMAKHAGYADTYNVTVKYSFGRQATSPHPDFRYNPSLNDIYMLVAVFKHSHLLVNHSSTVAIESFAADVPVINVKYGRSLDWWHWYRSMVYRDFKQHYRDITEGGATTIVSSERQLIRAINRYFDNPALEREQRAQTLRKMITTVDGTASKKVFEFIKSVA